MTESIIAKILGWLKAGYPEGIPAQDIPSVLLVLRRNLTDADLESIADDLVAQSISAGSEPITADDIRTAVREHLYQNSTDEDVRRVSAVLASGGWPLAADVN